MVTRLVAMVTPLVAMPILLNLLNILLFATLFTMQRLRRPTGTTEGILIIQPRLNLVGPVGRTRPVLPQVHSFSNNDMTYNSRDACLFSIVHASPFTIRQIIESIDRYIVNASKSYSVSPVVPVTPIVRSLQSVGAL